MEPSLLTIVLAVLATCRFTRLVVSDDIFAPVVGRVLTWAEASGGIARREWWNSLLSCWYCSGWWISLAAVLFYAALPEAAFQWLCAPWALSYAIVIIATVIEE